MHKIDRTAVAEPACLAQYDHNTQTWDDLRADHKREIRETLETMQQGRCAYCEGPYYSNDRHIEHFKRKNPGHFPELTFVWKNLFLSCDADAKKDHCGHYKDQKGDPYNPQDLIKPDEDDPDDFLYFCSSGEARLRAGVEEKSARRADETIRVLNLNNPRLMASRRKAVKSYLQSEPDILEVLENWTAEERQGYVEMEIKSQIGSCYITTIRHFLKTIDKKADSKTK